MTPDQATATAEAIKSLTPETRVKVLAQVANTLAGQNPTTEERAAALAQALADHGGAPAAPVPEVVFKQDIEVEAYKQLIRHKARERLQQHLANESPAAPFDAGTLAEILARPEPPTDRIDRLLGADASMLIVAQRKTGKTTLELNLAHSFLTGRPFLGTYATRPLDAGASVCILNYEVSSHQMARWADDHGLPADRLYLVNLRGRSNPLGNPTERARLAAELRAHRVGVLIVDPFGRAFTNTNQNDAGEVTAWLGGLDTFTREEVGATELILAAHAGWNGDRTRGSTALEDWADTIVTLTCGKDDDEHTRYLRAIGRDVDLDEDALAFDETTRTLTLTGTGSRRQTSDTRRVEELVPTIVNLITLNGGWNTTDVARALRTQGIPYRNGEPGKALNLALQRGILRMENGARGAKHYYLNTTIPTAPQPFPGITP